jgi:hypothetical protein
MQNKVDVTVVATPSESGKSVHLRFEAGAFKGETTALASEAENMHRAIVWASIKKGVIAVRGDCPPLRSDLLDARLLNPDDFWVCYPCFRDPIPGEVRASPEIREFAGMVPALPEDTFNARLAEAGFQVGALLAWTRGAIELLTVADPAGSAAHVKPMWRLWAAEGEPEKGDPVGCSYRGQSVLGSQLRERLVIALLKARGDTLPNILRMAGEAEAFIVKGAAPGNGEAAR